MEPKVGVVTGSKSDLKVMEKCCEVLNQYGIKNELKVLSAHRTPDEATAFAVNARESGIDLIVAGAGMAAHLAGVVASRTTLPVIGVPLKSGDLGGMDALLSTVQMPPGIPVATVAVDGAKNAAHLAAQILSLKYPELEAKIMEQRNDMKKNVLS